MIDPKFTQFLGGQAGKGGTTDGPHVTISPKGLIYMNQRAYDALGRPGSVTLYYSREDAAIAVEPVHPPTSASFKVVKRQMGWAIHASSFCRHFGLRVAKTLRFLDPEPDSVGILVLCLRKTVTVGGLTRRKRPSAVEAGAGSEQARARAARDQA